MGRDDVWPKECRNNVSASYESGTILVVYIDDLVVKLAGFMEHLANLRVTYERMRSSNIKMNPLKCAFGISAGKFLGLIVHEKGIEIDPKKVESIGKLGKPTCNCNVQKLLGNINYLRRFITNLAGKLDSFMPLVQPKHENEFMWGRRTRQGVQKNKGIFSYTTSFAST
jgi:hypothetical protein